MACRTGGAPAGTAGSAPGGGRNGGERLRPARRRGGRRGVRRERDGPHRLTADAAARRRRRRGADLGRRRRRRPVRWRWAAHRRSAVRRRRRRRGGRGHRLAAWRQHRLAVGGGAAASVPARRASALYWAWAPAAATCCVVWPGRWCQARRDGPEWRPGPAWWWWRRRRPAAALSAGNWSSGAGVVVAASRPVGSRSAMVWQPAADAVRASDHGQPHQRTRVMFRSCPKSRLSACRRTRCRHRPDAVPQRRAPSPVFRYTAMRAMPTRQRRTVAKSRERLRYLGALARLAAVAAAGLSQFSSKGVLATMAQKTRTPPDRRREPRESAAAPNVPSTPRQFARNMLTRGREEPAAAAGLLGAHGQTRKAGPLDPLNISGAMLALAKAMGGDREAVMRRPRRNGGTTVMTLWESTARRMLGGEAAPVVEPAPGDRRFRGRGMAAERDLRFHQAELSAHRQCDAGDGGQAERPGRRGARRASHSTPASSPTPSRPPISP